MLVSARGQRRDRGSREHGFAVGGQVADERCLLSQLATELAAVRGADGGFVIVAVDAWSGPAFEQGLRAFGEDRRDRGWIGLLARAAQQHFAEVALSERALPRGQLDQCPAVAQPPGRREREEERQTGHGREREEDRHDDPTPARVKWSQRGAPAPHHCVTTSSRCMPDM